MFYSKLTKTAGAEAALLRAGRLGRRIDGEKPSKAKEKTDGDRLT